MKLDRRTLLIGAAVGVAVLLSARQGRHPAGAGGPCCVLPANLSLPPSNVWVAVESTNSPLGVTTGESLTNGQQ